MECSLPNSSVHGILQARTLEWVAIPFSRGIFRTQGTNPGLPHWRQILYPLSHQGSPRKLERVAYPFSRRPSLPRDQTGVSCTAGRFFTSWATREAPTFALVRSKSSLLQMKKLKATSQPSPFSYYLLMPKPKALEYSHKTTTGQVIWKTGVIKVRQKTLTKSNHTKYLSVQAQTQKIN